MVATLERAEDQISSLPVSEQPQTQYRYAAIVIPSYGMSRWETGSPYRMSFYSGDVGKAAVKRVKEGFAPLVILEGAQIFPDDSTNDGDVIKPAMIRQGLPESTIIQRRDTRNTYDQMEDAKETINQLGITGKVLVIHADLHRWRVPGLVKKHGISADTEIAENILSEGNPNFAHVWSMIKNTWGYRKTLLLEFAASMLMKVDRRDKVAKWLSARRFRKHGADVPDVRRLQTIRSY